MKKLTKHLSAIAMAFAIVLTTIIPVTVEAKPSYEEKFTAYRQEVYANFTTSTYLYVSNLGKSDTIKKSSVKSSNTKSVKLTYLEKNYSGYEREYFSSQYKPNKGNYCSYHIGLELYKPGKSTITFKIGKKVYQSVVTVLKYENPLKYAKILGKDYAGQLKNQRYTDIKAKKTQKNQVFTFEANKNWKISSVEIYRYEKVDTNYYSSNYSQIFSYTSPLTKTSCNVGNIEKGKYYNIMVNMYNTKTGGSITAQFEINSPF